MKNEQTKKTRRDFLKDTSLAAAGFFIVPRHVLGRGFIPPSDKLNIAGIGAGGKAEVNIPYAYNNGSDNIVSLCDVDDRMAVNARKKWPNAPYYRDYRELLDKEAKNIDAVIITTPDHMHTPIALVQKMNEIIWAMNEKNDTLEDLLFYTRSYAMEYCEENNLECTVDLPDPVPKLLVSGEIRRNVFLTIKESLHNIVKHAKASKVLIQFEMNDHLHISICDNGRGIVNNDKPRQGNGLLNMQKRIKLLGGTLELKNGHGLTVEFRVPLKFHS